MHFPSAYLIGVVYILLGPFFVCVSASKATICRESHPGRYVVRLVPDVDIKAFLDNAQIISIVSWKFFNGFAASLRMDQIQKLCNDPRMQSISVDGVVNYKVEQVSQRGASWNLERMASESEVETEPHKTYPYDVNCGRGVDIYVLDTGVFIDHADFGGRATWGENHVLDADPNRDMDGHGTHVAGIAAGTRYGVAKKANIIAVKVLNDNGNGILHDVISGINYVLQEKERRQNPAVVCLSFSMPANDGLDHAVQTLTHNGVHVVVAAGNNNRDATQYSPGRELSVITVGSIDIHDHRVPTSNYGPRVDVYAPGASILSAYIGNRQATNIMTGTSMAAPHVAGLVACLITRERDVAPAIMKAKVAQLSLPIDTILPQIPAGHVNRVAHLPSRVNAHVH